MIWFFHEVGEIRHPHEAASVQSDDKSLFASNSTSEEITVKDGHGIGFDSTPDAQILKLMTHQMGIIGSQGDRYVDYYERMKIVFPEGKWATFRTTESETEDTLSCLPDRDGPSALSCLAIGTQGAEFKAVTNAGFFLSRHA